MKIHDHCCWYLLFFKFQVWSAFGGNLCILYINHWKLDETIGKAKFKRVWGQDKRHLVLIFWVLVILHLEYCAQDASPDLRKDLLVKVEVHQWFIRWILGMVRLLQEGPILTGVSENERWSQWDTLSPMNCWPRTCQRWCFPWVGCPESGNYSLNKSDGLFRTKKTRNIFSHSKHLQFISKGLKTQLLRLVDVKGIKGLWGKCRNLVQW